ncbi:MAG: uncharacterized protein QOH53_1300 [Ilumatobacteraceae bacterium]
MLPRGLADHGNEKSSGTSPATIQLVRRLFPVIETRDTAAIWSMFADDGVIEYPFINLRLTDLASFDQTIGPALRALEGLTVTDLTFVATADPNAVIAKYHAHATVNFTGKPYDQTYINELRVRHGKIALYSEYYDTAVFNEAFTP